MRPLLPQYLTHEREILFIDEDQHGVSFLENRSAARHKEAVVSTQKDNEAILWHPELDDRSSGRGGIVRDDEINEFGVNSLDGRELDGVVPLCFER